MHTLPVNSVKEGARLAKSVFGPEGKILLKAGTRITKNHLAVICEHDIDNIYIDDENESCMIRMPESYCESTCKQAEMLVKKQIDSDSFTHYLNSHKVKDAIYKIIGGILNDEGIVANLAGIRSVDDYTFKHSINVCTLSLIMGIGIGYNELRLKDLGTGAILHDIGKLRIPESILKKPSKLTDEEFDEIKRHTIYGYEILKENKDISMISAFVAIGHHERYDGSGYPLHIKRENIHECARIVAIADVFDALNSDRVYRKKMNIYDIIDYITTYASCYFDRKIVNSFVKYVSIFPVGSGVILNTGERGLVAGINKNMPTRPVVKVIYNEKGEKLEKNYEVDLTKTTNILIKDLCELQTDW